MDFRIQGLNLLPDLVGYVLIFSGLGHVQKHIESEYFSTAETITKPFIALSAINIYNFYQPPQDQWGQMMWEHQIPLMVLVTIINSILVIMLVYHICKGISSLADNSGNTSLQQKASSRWLMFMVMQVCVLMVVLITFTLESLRQVLILLIPTAVFTLVVHVLLMTLMIEAGRQLTSNQIEN